MRVSLELRDGTLTVEVRDSGRGMALPAAAGHAAAAAATAAGGAAGLGRLDVATAGLGDVGPSAGLGLFGAHERIALVGGRFSLESVSGQGTTVRAVIPVGYRSAPSPATPEPHAMLESPATPPPGASSPGP